MTKQPISARVEKNILIMKTQKLIKEYENKINYLDHAIKTSNEQLRLRRNDSDKTELDEWLQRRQIQNTKRQSYVQFIIDLKNIQDV